MNNRLTSSLFCPFLSFPHVFVVYIMHFISDFCSFGYYIPFSLPFSRNIAPQSLYCDWQLWYKNNHFFWLSTAFSQYCDKKRNRQWSTFLQNQILDASSSFFPVTYHLIFIQITHLFKPVFAVSDANCDFFSLREHLPKRLLIYLTHQNNHKMITKNMILIKWRN